jgi:hypothetical protein
MAFQNEVWLLIWPNLHSCILTNKRTNIPMSRTCMTLLLFKKQYMDTDALKKIQIPLNLLMKLH